MASNVQPENQKTDEVTRQGRPTAAADSDFQPETVAENKARLKAKKKLDDDAEGDDILGKAYDGRLVRRFAKYLTTV